jgi:hypothetical protein
VIRAVDGAFCIATAKIYVVSLYTFTMVAIGTCELMDIAPETLGLLNAGERDLINWFVLVTSSTISG